MTYSFKFSTRYRISNHIKKVYKQLVGKESPPIDQFFFSGKSGQPITKLLYYIDESLGRTLINWDKGRLTDKTYHFNSNIVGLAITVADYTTSGSYLAHAISAVRYNNILFCFNSWGKSARKIDSNIFNELASLYNCKTVFIYNGPNIQAENKLGVCVGLSSNFIIEMLLKIEENKLPLRISPRKYDSFIYDSLTSRGICFGRTCVSADSLASKFHKININLMRKENLFSNNINVSSMKVSQLKSFAKNHSIKQYSGLKKANLIKKIRNELFFKKRSELENIEFQTSPVQKQSILNTMTLVQLKKYASNRKIAGRSKYIKKVNLLQFLKTK